MRMHVEHLGLQHSRTKPFSPIPMQHTSSSSLLSLPSLLTPVERRPERTGMGCEVPGRGGIRWVLVRMSFIQTLSG
ncbi:hypothetical protein WG66_005670 [Moniliophthora roreri]|nr:hypothetical protein WG66_005670 [Moniliophthora roreri]